MVGDGDQPEPSRNQRIQIGVETLLALKIGRVVGPKSGILTPVVAVWGMDVEGSRTNRAVLSSCASKAASSSSYLLISLPP